jgi:uronate dehydrogenase
MKRLVITGAAGRIGSVLRHGLQEVADELCLVDLVEIAADHDRERTVVADLADIDSALVALNGADAVVHLAGIPAEDSFDRLLGPNFVATYNVFEAARRQRVRRVVFASSNHATGMYPVGKRIGPDDPVRPDTLYGVSKVFGEGLGRLYVDKHGLEVVCLRIGSFRERPQSWRELWTWLSHRDAVALFRAALSAPDVGFITVYGVSANTRGWWDDSNARRLGYEPRDDAEQFVPELAKDREPPDEFQGGPFASR